MTLPEIVLSLVVWAGFGLMLFAVCMDYEIRSWWGFWILVILWGPAVWLITIGVIAADSRRYRVRKKRKRMMPSDGREEDE